MLEGDGVGFDARNRIPSPYRNPLADRHDRTGLETRALDQVVDINRASVRLKEQRPRGHPGGVNDDVTIGMRADFERRRAQRK
jgi:hypothetical protein